MKFSSVKNQYFAVICANLMTIGYGTSVGWTSAAFLVLSSLDDYPLETGPLSIEQISWTSSILCIGGFIGNLLYGWLGDRIGRKLSMCFIALPEIASWILIIVAKTPTYLYVSRFLCGLCGGGLFVIMPLYVTEIAEDRIRGTLGSLLTLSCNIGILISFILGYYLPYGIIPYVLMVFPILFVCIFIFFPETPYYLIINQKEKEAETALRYLRNLSSMSQQYSENFAKEMKMLQNNVFLTKTDTSLRWSDFNTKASRKAFTIGLALMALNQFCGCFAMINYAATIFNESGSVLSPKLSAIIVGVITLIGSYVPTLLVERVGRKILIFGSALGTSFGLTTLAVYITLTKMNYNLDGLHWIPITCFSLVLFVASFGVLTLPFMYLTEIMPMKIRSIGTCFCVSVQWLFAFTMVKFMPVLQTAIGMEGCFFLFATCSLLGAIYVWFAIPETKGKSFDEITKELES